jgi:hypothetical protein
MNEVAQPIRDWLSARDFMLEEDSSLAPLLRGQVTAEQVGDLAALTGVKFLDVDEWPGRELSTAWFDTVGAGGAQTLSSGARKICAVEGGGPASTTYLPVAATASPSGAMGAHMEQTLGFIRNTLNSFTMTTAATLYAGNSDKYVPTASAKNVEEWCMDQFVTGINFSWSFSNGTVGGLSGSDQQKDYLTIVPPYPLFTLAAGNGGTNSGADAVHNRGHNGLVVGASYDKATSTPTDDVIASFSSWRNPSSAHNDRELPSLVAPGQWLDVMNHSGISGTSFSAPIVAGAAALVTDEDPATFSIWPEMMRSVLQATATRNISGSELTNLNTVTLGSDERDGVGLLNAYAATQLAHPSNYRAPNTAAAANGRYRKTLWWTEFTGSMANDFWNIQPSQTGRMRVVIVWDSMTSCSDSGCKEAVADLDLIVETPTGVRKCGSVSFDNSWEFCDFAVNAGENYKVRVRKWAVPVGTSYTYFSVAWHNYASPSRE